MEDIFCFAVLIGKVLCFAVFIAAVSPSHFGTVEAMARPVHATPKPAYCEMERPIPTSTLIAPRAI